MKGKIPQIPIKSEFIAFAGGLDIVTPPLSIPPGFCRSAQNFEQDINGGYASVTGYERFDGQAKPSDATYSVLTATITGAVTTGDVLTDNAAAAYGTVIALPDGLVILTKVTGTFAAGNVKVGATVVGTCTSSQIVDGADTSLLHAQYRNLAADVYRAEIDAVPGSGAILGVWQYNNVTYAFRNNVGGTATDMYKSTAAGWALVALGREINFTSGGVTPIAVGNVITGATSGATATITGVALESGSWASGTATGHFTFASQTGTFQAEDLNVGATLNLATIAGNSSAISFSVPGGRFEFITETFGGGANTSKMYGCDGKNRGFEFDGTTLIPINTGMAGDAPTHITSHKNHLFFSFAGSAQHSGIGQPFTWTAVTGAAEIAMGDTITGFMPQPGSEAGGALAIFSRNSTRILYGSSVSDWNLATFNNEAGAIAHTIQNVSSTIMFDDRGISSLSATQSFGNFAEAALSRQIQPWLKEKRDKITGSCIIRDKNQYRLFFSDGYAVYVTFNNKKMTGMMPIYFLEEVRCVCSSELSDGTEAIFFGSDNGYVYQMDKGTSFDGDAIEAFFDLAFNHSKSPRVNKRYSNATFEISGNGYAEYGFSYELGYGEVEIDQPGTINSVTSFTNSLWDTFTWDSFTWDGRTLLPSTCDMTGTAENMSLKIRFNSDYFSPIKFSGALIHYSLRRNLR